MRRVDKGTGIFFVVFGAIALVMSLQLPLFQNGSVPGPGMFPVFLSCGIVVFGAILAITRVVRDGDFGEFSLPPRPALIRVSVVMASFAVSVFLISVIGFVVSAILFCAIFIFGIEGQRNVAAYIVTIAIPLGFYYLFDIVLKVPLPMGVFER